MKLLFAIVLFAANVAQLFASYHQREAEEWDKYGKEAFEKAMSSINSDPGMLKASEKNNKKLNKDSSPATDIDAQHNLPKPFSKTEEGRRVNDALDSARFGQSQAQWHRKMANGGYGLRHDR